MESRSHTNFPVSWHLGCHSISVSVLNQWVIFSGIVCFLVCLLVSSVIPLTSVLWGCILILLWCYFDKVSVFWRYISLTILMKLFKQWAGFCIIWIVNLPRLEIKTNSNKCASVPVYAVFNSSHSETRRSFGVLIWKRKNNIM